MRDAEIKLITEAAHYGLLCVDAQGKITFWNASVEEILGWKKEEIVKRPLANILSPKHHPQIPEIIVHLSDKRKPGGLCFELTALHKAGNEIPIEMSVMPAYQGNQKVLCITLRDVSAHRQEIEKLRESQQKYVEMINTIDVIVWEVDVKSFMFTYVSSQAVKVLGYPLERWTTEATFWADTIHPDDREWALNFCAQSLKERGTYSFEYRMLAMDGRVVWLRDVVTVIFEEGKPKQLRGILMDVTESRELEDLLKKAEERYRSIFENAAEGIYQSTPDGKFLTANPSLAKMFGFASADEMIETVQDITIQLFADVRDREHINRTLEEEGRAIGVEFQSVKNNGEVIWVRGHIRAIKDKANQVKYYEGTLEDVTERRMAEEQLMTKLVEVQKTNFELDHFVYSVSHDLRSPIATVQGLLNIAEKEKLSPASENYMRMIRASINRMEEFIKDILEYSRNSRMEVTVEKIKFLELVTNARNLLREISGVDQLQIKIEVDDQTDFYSDATRLTIVLKNMLANAIRYQDPKKESTLTVTIASGREVAVITFHDNGLGIEQNQLAKIFNMFYRASEISTGAGLGLYIAKEVITKLGGIINVYSELGVFTTFEVRVPNLSTLRGASAEKLVTKLVKES